MIATARMSLAGYDCLTETDPDHYSLVSDSDNVLIKELARGSGSISTPGGSVTIAHNLGYVPFVIVMGKQTDPVATDWSLCLAGQSESQLVETYLDTTNLYIKISNNAGDYKYYLFYDQQV